MATSSNDYHHNIIELIAKETGLSHIALYTRLLIQNKITPYNYSLVKHELDAQYQQWIKDKNEKLELNKLEGKASGGMTPVPIQSPLLISTIQRAYYSGVLNEFEVCKTLNISPDKLNKYIQ